MKHAGIRSGHLDQSTGGEVEDPHKGHTDENCHLSSVAYDDEYDERTPEGDYFCCHYTEE